MKKEMNKKIFLSLIIIGLLVVTVVPLVAALGPVETLAEVGYWLEGFIETAGRYIFGPTPAELSGTYGGISAWIVIFCVWALIVLTFGDILMTFSSFSKPISWLVAIILGIMAANLRLISVFVIEITGWFVIFGTTAIFIGLFGAIIAFVAVNFGVYQLGGWIMKRKAMMEAAKAESGGEELAGKIRGLNVAGEALKNK